MILNYESTNSKTSLGEHSKNLQRSPNASIILMKGIDFIISIIEAGKFIKRQSIEKLVADL